MRGTWVLGIVVIVGACGADEPTSALPTNAPDTTIEPTTAAPVKTESPTTSAAAPVPASTTAAVVMPTAPVVSITAPEAVGLDGEWRVMSGIVDGEPVQLLDGSPITLTAAGPTLSGSSPCNSYEFTIEPREAGVEIVDGFVTEVGCDATLTALEEIYLRSVGPTASYTVDATTLTWQTPTATWVFERIEPTAPVSLVGTVWVLNGVLYEFGGMSAPGIEAGRIVFAADGTFTGSTSCRDFTGTWATDGTTINASDVSIDGACVGRLVDIDEIVAQVLREGFAATIDGDRLSARPRDNLGLDFFAE